MLGILALLFFGAAIAEPSMVETFIENSIINKSQLVQANKDILISQLAKYNVLEQKLITYFHFENPNAFLEKTQKPLFREIEYLIPLRKSVSSNADSWTPCMGLVYLDLVSNYTVENPFHV